VNEAPELLYLEADDEVTSIVRRLRSTDAARVVLVAPGRSRATSSVVALRLLARMGDDSGRRIAVVGDPLTRSLAVEAGLETHASVDDARNAIPAPASDVPARRASIHVVRGPAADDPDATAPVVLAAATRATEADTRPVPVIPRTPSPPPAGERSRGAARPRLRSTRGGPRTLPLAIGLGLLAALMLTGVVAGAFLLPAATIAVVPRSEPLGPESYTIEIGDPERIEGAVEAEAVVTASGTYPIQAAATGTVVFLNWNVVNVEVPAGTLVAAGDQAFETTGAVVVQAGSLTGDGRIQAGEGAADVVAAAIGPAANVAAGTITSVLSREVDVRLRGFANNSQPRVVNPEATSGGVDTTGPEITQADVDAAVATLSEVLTAAAADAVADVGADSIYADPAEPPEPTISGVDGLAGTRDQPTAEITGTLAYDRLSVAQDAVVALGKERLATDPDVLPPGHQLLPAATEVAIGTASRSGDRLSVAVTVTGASTRLIDEAAVLERVRGRSAAEARAALEEMGAVATVDLWPQWASTVPELDWRIEIRIAGESTSEALIPSASVPASR
jgi:hypothetical protein